MQILEIFQNPDNFFSLFLKEKSAEYISIFLEIINTLQIFYGLIVYIETKHIDLPFFLLFLVYFQTSNV